MSVVQTLIGNIKGPQGETGATGATGAAGAAATVEVGSVTSTAYGNPAQVTNSGTDTAAVLDFVIPQGAPGEEVTDLSNLSIGSITTQTAQYPTPQIGDTGATLVGKIIKYFSDLRTLIGTKLDAANVVNNKTTTESGYALDARQANPNVSGTLAAQISALNTNLTALQGQVFAGNVAAGTDIDTVVSVGIHNIPYSSGGYPHAPEDNKYGILLVLKGYTSNVTAGSVAYQVWIMIENVYVRGMGNTVWNNWYKYSGTRLS